MNPQLYDNLPANWTTVLSGGYRGEVHLLTAAYSFDPGHLAGDIQPFDITWPVGAATAALAVGTGANMAVGPFTSNPIIVTVPGTTSYRYLVWTLASSHTPLLCLDLGAVYPAPDTATITITQHFWVGA